MTVGAADLVTAPRVEKVANVLMFVPIGLLLVLAFPRVRGRTVIAGCGLVSLAVETAQAVLLAGRTPSLLDVALNTAGAALGVWLALALRR